MEQGGSGKRRGAGLFSKYFAFIGLLVSAGLVASGAVGLYFSYQETRNSLVSLQREKALTAAVRIEQFLRDIESQLGWTSLTFVTPGQSAMEGRRLDFIKVLRQLPAVTEVRHLDGAGREQLKVSRLELDTFGGGIDYSASPRFIEARKGKAWFGPVEFRKETEPYMPIAIPEARDRPGATVVEVNLKFIWEVVSRIRIGQKGVAYVVDGSGFLIAHPDISMMLRKVNLAELPQVREALAAPAGFEWREVKGARDSSGEAVLSAYARVEPTGWLVFVEEPESAVFAPLYAALLRTAVLLLAGVALSVFAALVLARRMVKPVRALQQGADRIRQGDLVSRIDVHTGDELEDLADRFNTMSDELRESYADLEQKVESRTAELRESLEQQTAVGEILRVISSSPTDAWPVFEAVAHNARRLCAADNAAVVLRRGDELVPMAASRPEEMVEPFPFDRGTVTGRSIAEGRTLSVGDILALGDDFAAAKVHLHIDHARAMIATPLVRDGHALGAIALWRSEPLPFTARQVELAETFARQAVIAIENVRLFNEIQEKSRQLEAANKHKSDFLANMSHELRTPLNAIIGFSEVMLTGMTGPVVDQQKEFIGDIRDSGKHLLALINDILDLSKIEAGRMELDRARFDLRSAMDNAMTLVRGRAERGGIALDIAIAAEVDDYLGDERKFKQIVLNLLSNAVKFTPEGGRVTLGARRANGAYVFDVSDTGVGIAPEDQQLIFEEFRQVGSDYERKAEGTGLGLALTRRLVELHGGDIRVASAPGRGSTFTFTLPLEAEAA